MERKLIAVLIGVPPLILRQTAPVHYLPSCFFNIYFNITILIAPISLQIVGDAKLKAKNKIFTPKTMVHIGA
jgi:hypothetical protein